MNLCATCGGTGIVRLNWADKPEDFALCLCDAADWFRSDCNAGKRTGYCGWQVWCAREQINPSRIYLLEEVLTSDELQAAGFDRPAHPHVMQSREAALLASGKSKRGKL